MTKQFFIASTLLLTASASFAHAQARFALDGSVTEQTVAAIETHPLHLYTTPAREQALQYELRIRDENGRSIPTVLRKRQKRTEEKTKVWHTLKIKNVFEKDEALVVETEFPLPSKDEPLPNTFAACECVTDLNDFNQTIKIYADDTLVHEGQICDYRKFANFRRTSLDFASAFQTNLTFVFTHSQTLIEKSLYERTTTTNKDENNNSEQIKQTIEKRPFKITALRVAEEKIVPCFKPEDPIKIDVPAETSLNKKKGVTTLLIAPRGAPLAGLAIQTTAENFQYPVTVSRRKNNGWETFYTGDIKNISLPGQHSDQTILIFAREVCEETLKIDIAHGPDASFNLKEFPVTLHVIPYDALFIAKPDQQYCVCIENGASLPTINPVILEYVQSVKDAQRFTYTSGASWQTPLAPSSLWSYNPITLISVLAFLILGGTCLWLFRATRT